MSPEELLQSLGVRVVFEDVESPRYQELGSRLDRAAFVRDRRTFELLVVATPRDPLSYHDSSSLRGMRSTHDILHEGAHVLCGPASFKSEHALFYLQWVLSTHLATRFMFQMHEYLRRNYYFPVGDPISPDFPHVRRALLAPNLEDRLSQPEYRGAALAQGLVGPNDEILVRGPHPQWSGYDIPQDREGPPDPWDPMTW